MENKVKDYDCSCKISYPNDLHKKKNGKWKCVDCYDYVGRTRYGTTHCKRKEWYKGQGKKMKQIKIRYAVEGLEKLEKIAKGDMIDLRAAEDVEMKAGEYKLISLGVAMELPKGYEAHVYPRSSTFKNWGILLVNSVGVIDETYKGNNDIWRFPAYATRDTVIHKNDRICQFRIIEHQPEIEFVEVESLDNENRGGIGSTGTR